eukprot:TRINITY_DN67006_c13_g3_i1.p1 TRINITY_DN67006_c13_g3~~TRINITY_DN67006_c13_g3_i1.p1  ORF type:complete len:330 (+),score=25.83 TRINITY_DN67006_c13_g3_i1:68-1057(+)
MAMSVYAFLACMWLCVTGSIRTNEDDVNPDDNTLQIAESPYPPPPLAYNDDDEGDMWIYELIWKPMENELEPSTLLTVYVSPHSFPSNQLSYESLVGFNIITPQCHATLIDLPGPPTYLTAAHCFCYPKNKAVKEFLYYVQLRVIIQEFSNPEEECWLSDAENQRLMQLPWCSNPDSLTDWVTFTCKSVLGSPVSVTDFATASITRPVALVARWGVPISTEEMEQMLHDTGFTEEDVQQHFGGSPPCINYQAGALTKVATNGKMRYNVNTMLGWSGATLWQVVEGGKWKVVGMHMTQHIKRTSHKGCPLHTLLNKQAGHSETGTLTVSC